MVKKLFKHEYYALLRLMIPAWCALLCVSVFGRFIQLLEHDNIAYKIVSGSSIFFYVVVLMACLACPTVFAVVRFYRNLFSGEGYLMFTLPVTTTQHLWVKLTVALTMQIATWLVAVSSVFVLTFGDLGWEIGKAAWYLLDLLAEKCNGHFPVLAVEAMLFVIAMAAYAMLVYYACICIGQLFGKMRLLMAFVAYFAFYTIMQVFETILLIVMAVIDMDTVMLWVSNHMVATAHITMCYGIVQSVILGAVFYLVSHYIIRHRLNLE